VQLLPFGLVQSSIWLLLFALQPSGAALLQAASPDSATQAGKGSVPADLMNYFAGKWSGKGQFANSGKELESDFSFVPDLENQCLVVRQKERSPNTFQFMALWSVDSVSEQWVMMMVSNHDGGARLFRTDGWHDGKLVFQSVPELHSSFALERFTFERQSTTVFRTTYEMSFDDGKTWKIGDRQTFTKSSP
jgi:hypothetical protein